MRLSFAATIVAFSLVPQVARAQTTRFDRPWSVSVTSGISDFSGDKARPFGSVSLSRDFGELALGLAGSIVDSGETTRAGGALGSTTRQITLSAGYAFGSVSLDIHGALGRRSFDTAAFARASGLTGTLASKGKSASIGASLTDDVPLGRSTFLSPFVSIDYNRVDVARAVTLPARSFVLEQRAKGVTGAAGATLVQAFGRDDRHNVGVYAAAFATSNNAASAIGVGLNGAAPRSLTGTGSKDLWLEAGPTASVALTTAIHLDLAATRTFGLKSGNGTTASAGLRIAF